VGKKRVQILLFKLSFGGVLGNFSAIKCFWIFRHNTILTKVEMPCARRCLMTLLQHPMTSQQHLQDRLEILLYVPRIHVNITPDSFRRLWLRHFSQANLSCPKRVCEFQIQRKKAILMVQLHMPIPPTHYCNFFTAKNACRKKLTSQHLPAEHKKRRHVPCHYHHKRNMKMVVAHTLRSHRVA
jgi:hypothetical protein